MERRVVVLQKEKEYHHIDCIKNNKKYIEQYEKEKGSAKTPLGFCPEAEYKRKGCKVPPIECDPKRNLHEWTSIQRTKKKYSTMDRGRRKQLNSF